MKTFSKTVLAAAVALVGSTVMAQSPYRGSFAPAAGSCPNGQCGTTAGCVNGSCGVAGCPDGKCGPMGCPNGKCGVVPAYGQYPTANRYAQPVHPQSAALGYKVLMKQPYYGVGSAACPNGNCPRPGAVTHAVGYRPVPATAACPNGRCATVPVPRQPNYATPRFNLLGAKW